MEVPPARETTVGGDDIMAEVNTLWPPTMRNALLKLWQMFEDNRSGRRKGNLESLLTIHHLIEEKKNLDANYDILVEDVNQLLNAEEDRVMDFSYLRAKMHRAKEKKVETKMEKKEVEKMKLQEKYAMLMNLVETQGGVIRNVKVNHLKEKEKLTEDNNNLKVQVDELTKSEK
ncbi:hypothetical protein ZWY2020_006063 [Hordeum vulgare]|nr:hypothetical protein ZWY2020_006063 [Hordeum vulgare]